jgi:hypothetical protein
MLRIIGKSECWHFFWSGKSRGGRTDKAPMMRGPRSGRRLARTDCPRTWIAGLRIRRLTESDKKIPMKYLVTKKTATGKVVTVELDTCELAAHIDGTVKHTSLTIISVVKID